MYKTNSFHNFTLMLMALFLWTSCQETGRTVEYTPENNSPTKLKALEKVDLSPDTGTVEKSLVDSVATSFDYPVGKPEAKGYYNAQKFGENEHLGDDWNGVGGGNTDLGDPIFSVAYGYVFFAEDLGGGWGNVIRIRHILPSGKEIESLYAHCDTILVQANHWVNRGDKIGTIGTAHGAYLAHLHFEIRDKVGMPIGGGYSSDTDGYLDPTKFIKNHH